MSQPMRTLILGIDSVYLLLRKNVEDSYRIFNQTKIGDSFDQVEKNRNDDDCNDDDEIHNFCPIKWKMRTHSENCEGSFYPCHWYENKIQAGWSYWVLFFSARARNDDDGHKGILFVLSSIVLIFVIFMKL